MLVAKNDLGVGAESNELLILGPVDSLHAVQSLFIEDLSSLDIIQEDRICTFDKDFTDGCGIDVVYFEVFDPVNLFGLTSKGI